MILLGPVLGSAVAVGATVAPVVRVRARQSSIDAERRRCLPELVDLLRLGVGAGLSVHQVIAAVEPHAPAVFAPSLGEVGRRVALGQRLGDALVALDDLGDPIRPLSSVLRAAAFDGVALGPALERVSDDARQRRRRSAEIAARRLPVQLLFPLVLCVLPAFGLLAIVPLLASSIGSLRW